MITYQLQKIVRKDWKAESEVSVVDHSKGYYFTAKKAARDAKDTFGSLLVRM